MARAQRSLLIRYDQREGFYLALEQGMPGFINLKYMDLIHDLN